MDLERLTAGRAAAWERLEGRRMFATRIRRGMVFCAALAIAATSGGASAGDFVLNNQGNQLDLYDASAAVPITTRTTPIPRHQHSETGPDDDGNDVNGQICKITQANGDVRFVMGEDSDQNLDPGGPDRDGDGEAGPSGTYQGWGLFAATGGADGPWTLVDKLVPQYNFTTPPNDHLPDNTGCAASADGSKLFLVDLGIGAFDVAGVGSLFVFYRDDEGDFSSASPYCTLANDLKTAGYIAIDPADGSVLVPTSGDSEGGTIHRFAPPFPASENCSAYLATQRTPFIQADPLSFTPISIAPRNGKWLVGNVVPGWINEYDADGSFNRPVVTVQGPGVAGMAVDSTGNLYFANLGLVPSVPDVFAPGDGTGSLWKVSFDSVTDAPLPAVPVNGGLNYPEGMGVHTLP